MIHYHGTPLTPESAAASVFAGRHAMVSFANPEQMPLMMEVCQSVAADNGAFPKWRAGQKVEDWEPFYEWIEQWLMHPSFDWFLIPDVIDGGEDENDELISECPYDASFAVPVWHLHESLQRLDRMANTHLKVALGSSGDYAQIGTDRWWHRMAETMEVLCVNGRPRCKLHGLRMLDPDIFSRFPFSSADSTNAARNVGMDGKWKGPYEPAGKAARGIVIAGRIESVQSASHWTPHAMQNNLWDL